MEPGSWLQPPPLPASAGGQGTAPACPQGPLPFSWPAPPHPVPLCTPRLALFTPCGLGAGLPTEQGTHPSPSHKARKQVADQEDAVRGQGGATACRPSISPLESHPRVWTPEPADVMPPAASPTAYLQLIRWGRVRTVQTWASIDPREVLCLCLGFPIREVGLTERRKGPGRRPTDQGCHLCLLLPSGGTCPRPHSFSCVGNDGLWEWGS